jgi:hypothetical protein
MTYKKKDLNSVEDVKTEKSDISKPGPKLKLTNKILIKALTKSLGIRSAAAKLLNVSPTTVYEYIHNHPEISEAIKKIAEEALDNAESALKRLIDKDNYNAIHFFMVCKGKHRGWTDEKTIVGDSSRPLKIVYEFPPTYKPYSSPSNSKLETSLLSDEQHSPEDYKETPVEAVKPQEKVDTDTIRGQKIIDKLNSATFWEDED